MLKPVAGMSRRVEGDVYIGALFWGFIPRQMVSEILKTREQTEKEERTKSGDTVTL